jgi:hypothetical protein
VIVGLDVSAAYSSIYGNKVMDCDFVCDIDCDIIAQLAKAVLSYVDSFGISGSFLLP